ncbi:hypothetical protein [Albidovulum sp.]|uniref:hypothetical protein n=1 Tax=Albidovulum sp. TaxID=1872424 RepID=UPI0039B99197
MGPEFGITVGRDAVTRPVPAVIRVTEGAGLLALGAGLGGAGWPWALGGVAAILAAYALYRRGGGGAPGADRGTWPDDAGDTGGD